MSKKTNMTTRQARDTQVIAGIGKHLQNASSITLTGTAYTPGALAAAYQAQLLALVALSALHAQVKDAVAAANAQEKELSALTIQLRDYLIQSFGNSATVLGDFGFTPKKVAKRKPVTKVVAAARNAATREERGTMGSVEKEAVKGSIPATVEINTATGKEASPAAPAASSTVAPQGAAGKTSGG